MFKFRKKGLKPNWKHYFYHKFGKDFLIKKQGKKYFIYYYHSHVYANRTRQAYASAYTKKELYKIMCKEYGYPNWRIKKPVKKP